MQPLAPKTTSTATSGVVISDYDHYLDKAIVPPPEDEISFAEEVKSFFLRRIDRSANALERAANRLALAKLLLIRGYNPPSFTGEIQQRLREASGILREAFA